MITTDTILDFLKDAIENKKLIDPNLWIDSCLKLNVLLSDDHDKLYDLQQQVALLKVVHIEDGKSVAEAKVRAEGSDLYKAMKKQEAKIERINEAIRIAKIQSRLKMDEYQNA